jgi:uncharacterized membrane protein (UPF0127 family)
MIQATITCPSGQTIRVEVARTERERARGLSGRAGLAPGTGLLLYFGGLSEALSHPTITMRGMQFDLDLAWLSWDKRMQFFICNAGTAWHGSNFTYHRESSSYVLELPAGDIQRLGLRLGDVLRF